MKTILALVLLALSMGFGVWAYMPETTAVQGCSVLSTACLNAPADFKHIVVDYHSSSGDIQPASEYVSLYKNSDDPEPTIRFEARSDTISRTELPNDFTCMPRGTDGLICHRPATDGVNAEETAILRPENFLGLEACDPSYAVLYLIPRAVPDGTRLEDYADIRQRTPALPRYTRWQAAYDRRKCKG